MEAQPADTPKPIDSSPSAADAAPTPSPAASEPADAPAASADPAVVALLTVIEPVSAPTLTPVSVPPPAQTEVLPAVAAPAAEPIRPRLKGPMVNVGLFADAANARRVQERLAVAKLPLVVDPVESSRGTLSRIRVGPFADKAQAEKAAA